MSIITDDICCVTICAVSLLILHEIRFHVYIDLDLLLNASYNELNDDHNKSDCQMEKKNRMGLKIFGRQTVWKG